MTIEILKAILVGIIAAMPVGPILIMVIQRTLCEGRPAGIMVGLGSAIAEGVYAAVALVTYELVAKFIDDYSALMLIVGGALIALVGVGILLKKTNQNTSALKSKSQHSVYLIQSFVSVISNPAALAVLMALLVSFGLGKPSALAPLWILSVAVAVGEALYWFLVVYVLSKFVKFSQRALSILSKVMGAAILVFALVLVVRGVIILV